MVSVTSLALTLCTNETQDYDVHRKMSKQKMIRYQTKSSQVLSTVDGRVWVQ